MASPISVTLAPRDPPAAVVALVGEHDAYSSQRLENELGLLMDEGRRVVVDLRDTEFIDSTTLAVLLGARKRAEQAGLGFVRRLAEDAGFPLSFTSTVGKGSEFSLDLPISDEPAPPVRPRRASRAVRRPERARDRAR